MNTSPICLTDPPWVVDLKREFRELDARVEDLKPQTACSALARAELERATARKREIGQTLFYHGHRATA